MTISPDLYEPHLGDSNTYLTTVTTDAGTPKERKYDALNIDLPDLLDAIAAEGLPVACPDCGSFASLQVPVKNPLQWEVGHGHLGGCSATRQPLRLVKP